ncbi:MAG: sigma-54-dependent Fis family transcriptional regulator, partial [Desulfobacterota bacterium]|nr:sigma-54-dependent Fis family transcriptional regulator [Thermodesulfobacteriota bacterium]
PILANEFIRRFAKEQNLDEKKIAPDAMDILVNYPWPGNVRELRNIVERLVIMTRDTIITREDINSSLNVTTTSNDLSYLFDLDLKEAKEKFEQQYLAYKLAQFGENISRTAEAIGIERKHLHRKIKNLKLKFKGEPDKKGFFS